MPEKISFFCMLLTLFSLTYGIGQALAALMQQLFNRTIAILDKPAKLLASSRKREVLLLFSLFFLYVLTAPFSASPAELIIHWVFITFMVFISLMDFEQQVILDKVLLSLLCCALVFSPFLPGFFFNRLLAALMGGGLLLLLAVLTKGGIGGGDIKLLFVLGLWLGTEKLLLVLFLGFLGGGLVSAILLLSKIKKRTDTLAYGPYFSLAAILALLY